MAYAGLPYAFHTIGSSMAVRSEAYQKQNGMKGKDSFINIEPKEFQRLFSRVEIPAKTILLNEGEISKKAYFIEKGCLRACFNNNGKDITFQFFQEKQMVASIESFKTNQPSLFTIETLEPSIVHAISKADFSAKMSIAYKECLETKYWLSLLKDSGDLSLNDFNVLFEKGDEIAKILFAILKTTRIKK